MFNSRIFYLQTFTLKSKNINCLKNSTSYSQKYSSRFWKFPGGYDNWALKDSKIQVGIKEVGRPSTGRFKKEKEWELAWPKWLVGKIVYRLLWRMSAGIIVPFSELIVFTLSVCIWISKYLFECMFLLIGREKCLVQMPEIQDDSTIFSQLFIASPGQPPQTRLENNYRQKPD